MPKTYCLLQEGSGISTAPSSKHKESTEKIISVAVESLIPKEQKKESLNQITKEPLKDQNKESVIQIKEEPVKEQRRESVVQFKKVPEKEQRRESIVEVTREPELGQSKATQQISKPIPNPVEKELPKSILKAPTKPSIPVAPKPPPAPPMAPLPPPPPGMRAPIISK